MSKCISISITKDYIHAVEMAVNGEKIKVKGFRSVRINEPALKNDTVNIENLKELFIMACVGMKAKDVYITAPVTTGVSNEYILPYDKKESHMRSMIWGNISSNLSPDKYLMDYTVASVFDGEGGKKCKVVAYLMLRSTIRDIHEAVLGAGLNPKGFNMTQNCIFKLYKATMGRSATLFANLSSDEIKLHLINPPDTAISRATAVSDNDFLEHTEGNHLHNILVDQVSKMFQFQSIKQPDKPIIKVHLFGDLADEMAVAYLRERSDTDVALLSVNNDKIQLNGASLSQYAYNIGAVL